MPVKSLPLLQTQAAESTGGRAFPLPHARKPGDDSPAMICRAVFDEMCLLANGDFVCSSCDTSGQRVYGNAFKDRVADVFDGPRYREMRDWLLQSRPGSWCPAIQFHCPRRSSQPGDGDKTAGGRVKLLKIEPVTYCNIKCPACPVVTDFVDDPEVRERRGQKILPIEVMLDVVDQLPHLETILYYNFGEPFLHKGTIEFLREVRRRRPNLYIATNTNGLVLTPAMIEALGKEALMDYLVFSIDGAYPESYKKYRVGGDLAKALGKMEALVKTVRAAGNADRVRVVWQYIFFEWNDSDEELALAKKMAAEIGVPIDWIIPTGYGASKRFTHGSEAFARLTGGEDSLPHQSAPAKLTDRLRQHDLDAIDVFQKCPISCTLIDRWPMRRPNEPRRRTMAPPPPPPLPAPPVGPALAPAPAAVKLPFLQRAARRLLSAQARRAVKSLAPDFVRRSISMAVWRNKARCDARLTTTAEASITVPQGAGVLFEVQVENRLRPFKGMDRPDRFRLGVRLRTADGEFLRELRGVCFPPEAAQPGGSATASVKLFLTDEPGQYQLFLDVVDEVGRYWFSVYGTRPLVYQPLRLNSGACSRTRRARQQASSELSPLLSCLAGSRRRVSRRAKVRAGERDFLERPPGQAYRRSHPPGWLRILACRQLHGQAALHGSASLIFLLRRGWRGRLRRRDARRQQVLNELAVVALI